MGAGPLRVPPNTKSNFKKGLCSSYNKNCLCGPTVRCGACCEEVAGSILHLTKILNAPNTLADVIMGHVVASRPATWQLLIHCPKGIFPKIFHGIFRGIFFLIFFKNSKIKGYWAILFLA